MKTIIITGAGGYLGSTLISRLLTETNFHIIAMTSQPEKLQKKYENCDRIRCFSNDFLWNHSLPVSQPEALIHLAFARRFSADHEIAESIEFSRYVFESAKLAGIPKLIYISSQGVYGNTPELRTVGKTVPSPSMIYTLAKYATEQLLWSIFDKSTKTTATAIRLDSLAGNQKMLPAFVQNAIEKQHISLVGGTQVFSFMDVRDAAGGLISLLKTPVEKWKPIYNLGPNNRRYTIIQLAELTAEVARERNIGNVRITLEKKDIAQFAGMDSSEFIQDTGWTPEYDMKAVISGLFDEYLKKRK